MLATFQNLTIRNKALTVFGLIILLSAGAGLVTMSNVLTASKAVQDVRTVWVPSINLIDGFLRLICSSCRAASSII